MAFHKYYSLALPLVLLAAIQVSMQQSVSSIDATKHNCYQMYNDCLHPQHSGKEYETSETVNYLTISAFCEQHKGNIAKCLADKMNLTAPTNTRYKVFAECRRRLKSASPQEMDQAEHDRMRTVARLTDWACTFSDISDLHKPYCFNYLWNNCIGQMPNTSVCTGNGVICPLIYSKMRNGGEDQYVTQPTAAATCHTVNFFLVLLLIVLIQRIIL